MIKGLIKKFSENNKKSNTKKFKILLDFINSIKAMKQSLDFFEMSYSQDYLTLEDKNLKLKKEFELKTKLKLINDELEKLLIHFAARIHKYENENFGKSIYKILNYLITIFKKKYILNLENIIERKEIMFKELKFLKEAFENVQSQLFKIKKEDLFYFKDKLSEQEIKPSSLKKQIA